jgi:hypothetical protein
MSENYLILKGLMWIPLILTDSYMTSVSVGLLIPNNLLNSKHYTLPFVASWSYCFHQSCFNIEWRICLFFWVSNIYQHITNMNDSMFSTLFIEEQESRWRSRKFTNYKNNRINIREINTIDKSFKRSFPFAISS